MVVLKYVGRGLDSGLTDTSLLTVRNRTIGLVCLRSSVSRLPGLQDVAMIPK